jgi:hypothetical protein
VQKLAFLALLVTAQCALNSFKAQLHFAFCALVLKLRFAFAAQHFISYTSILAIIPTQYQRSTFEKHQRFIA